MNTCTNFTKLSVMIILSNNEWMLSIVSVDALFELLKSDDSPSSTIIFYVIGWIRTRESGHDESRLVDLYY